MTHHTRARRLQSRLFWLAFGPVCEALGRSSLAVLLWLGGGSIHHSADPPAERTP